MSGTQKQCPVHDKPGQLRCGKSGSRPISRVLSWAAIPLDPASPQGSSNQPGNDAGHVMVPLFGLAPGGVCRATRRCPRARCALTTPFHPCHAHLAMPFGGLFSVALSVGLRRLAVSQHRCPMESGLSSPLRARPSSLPNIHAHSIMNA